MRPHHILVALSLVVIGCGGSTPQPAGAATAKSAESAEQLFQRGRAAAERGDSVRAEQYVTLAIERGYPRGKALPLLLRVCLSSSRLRAALDHAESYLRDHPEQEGLRYLVATIYASLGQTENARLELEELLSTRPDNSDALYLAGVLASESDSNEARELFRHYLDVTPRGRRAAEVRSRLSRLAIQDGERERSVALPPAEMP